jgi:hypothetical protein
VQAGRRRAGSGRKDVPRAQLTVRDRELLAFVADHRLVLASHVRQLLGISEAAARARLGTLAEAGFLTQRTLFHQQPGCYQVTSPGLAAIGSPLPRPGLDLRCYMHDVGAAWLWLAARHGAFGQVREIISERQLRSRDGLPRAGGVGDRDGLLRAGGVGDRDGLLLSDARSNENGGPGERLGVRLGGYGHAGREQLHYPDLLLRIPDGRRTAVELELTGKGQRRREKILFGYGADPRIDAVVYLVNRREVAERLEASAKALGVESIVHVQPFAWTPSMQRLADHLAGHARRAPARSPTRTPAGRRHPNAGSATRAGSGSRGAEAER